MPVRIDRRQFLKAAGLGTGAVGAGLLLKRSIGTSTWATAARACRVGGNGTFVSTEEPNLGQTVALQRVYKDWDQQIFSPDVVASADKGRRLVISVFPATHAGVGKRWADIASGKYDADIKGMAAQLKAFAATHDKKVGFCFHHEPESELDGNHGPFSLGTEADFRAAFSHFFAVLKGQGVTNIRRTLILLGSNYRRGTADNYWPGGDSVDRVGVDCYNWFNTITQPTATWRSFQEIVQPAYDYAVTKGRILWVCETATLEDPNVPGRKAQWITDMRSTVKAMPNIRALMYFEGARNGWWLQKAPQGSPQSLAAFKALLADPYFI